MPIQVVCDSCAKKITVPEALAGKRGKCPACGTVISIPESPMSPQKQPPLKQELLPAVANQAFPPAITASSLPPSEVRKTKECLFCGEVIAAAAMKCKHCNEILDPALKVAHMATMHPPSSQVHIVQPPQQAPQPIIVQQTTITNAGYYRPPFNHLLHLLLTIFTCGAWLPVWIAMWLIYSLT